MKPSFALAAVLALALLFLLTTPINASVVGMLTKTGFGQSAVRAQFPAFFKYMLALVPSKECQKELGRFQPSVDDDTFFDKYTKSHFAAHDAICENLTKKCLVELGLVLAKAAGPELLEKQMKGAFGADKDFTREEYKLPKMLGAYHDDICAKSRARQAQGQHAGGGEEVMEEL